MDLKLQLKELRNKDLSSLNKEILELLIESMLHNIGSIDSELRDELIYQTFIRFMQEDVITEEQYQHILETCLDEQHLFFNIRDENTDSVFTRSFSSLVITAILVKDQQIGFLSEVKLQNILKNSVYYLKNELDTRGYVQGKGWAHSIAHGADLLVSIVKHPKFAIENSYEILSAVHNCLFKKAVYIDDEDERLAFVLQSLIERNIGENSLEEWIDQAFLDLEAIYQKEGFSDHYFRTKFTTATFFKTLYLRLGFNDSCSAARERINNHLKQLHRKVYG